MTAMSNIIRNSEFGSSLTPWDHSEGWRHNSSEGFNGGGCAECLLERPTEVISQTVLNVIPDQTYGYQYYLRRSPGNYGLTVALVIRDSLGDLLHQNLTTDLGEGYQLVSGLLQVPASESETISLTMRLESYYFDPQDLPPSLFVDQINLIQYQICFSSASLVKTEQGWISAHNLDPNIHRVYRTDQMTYIPLEIVVQAGMSQTYFQIPPDDSLEPPPNREHLLITSGHRVMHDGDEIKAREHPSRRRIRLSRPDIIYTLVCQDHCPVLVNGVSVMAYGLEEWASSRKSLLTCNIKELLRSRIPVDPEGE